MKPWLCLLCLSASAQAAIPGLAPEKAWDLGGYVKYMATATLPDQGDNGLDHLVHQRFNFEYRFDDNLRGNLIHNEQLEHEVSQE